MPTAATPSRGACGLPLDAELLLEVGLVLLPERVVRLGRELAEGALADVVDVGVLGAGDAVALRAHADGEVVVLEHADAVGLVERADLVEDRAARGDAVHGGDADVEDAAAELAGARAAANAGRPRDLARSPARRGPRCRRSWSSGTAGRSRRRGARWPARRPMRPGGTTVSLLSRTTISPARQRDALVVGGREAAVLAVVDAAHARVARRRPPRGTPASRPTRRCPRR